MKNSKISSITKFLWWTAGGNKEILLRSTHSDRVKYMTLGGIIMATGIMAALAGGYAFYTIFAPHSEEYRVAIHPPTVGLSIIFGIFWGLIIFNIDRFIVTSTGSGDGTEKITLQEFKSAIPRLIMGGIIAITISKPVEIRMFQDEITAEVRKEQMLKEKEYINEIDDIYADRILSEKTKIANWEAEIKDKEARYVALEDEYIEEARIVKPGPKARAIKEQADRADAERKVVADKNKPLIEAAYLRLEKIEKEKMGELDMAKENAASLDGLLQRIKLAHKIAGTTISLFITLLFMAIELTPIFFKLMLIKSPYDYLVENEKETLKAEDGIYIEYNYYNEEEYPNKEGIERHLVRFLKKEKIHLEKLELLDAQKRLTKYAIKKFEEEQMKLIDKNPEQFISINSGDTKDEKDS